MPRMCTRAWAPPMRGGSSRRTGRWRPSEACEGGLNGSQSRAMGPETYDYTLPAELIAQQPCARRGEARLMMVGDPVTHHRVQALESLLPRDALVVVNAS